MRNITQKQLAEILDKHSKWLRDNDGGERANLCYADLRYADLRHADLSNADLHYTNLNCANLSYADLRYTNLSYADLNSANLRSANLRGADLSYAVLWGSTGNMDEIKSIALDTYPITYTAEYLQIGCERHRISEWWGFSDERISRMDRGALVWWQKWKGFIQQAIELSPATPTTTLAQMISSQDKD